MAQQWRNGVCAIVIGVLRENQWRNGAPPVEKT
jgi:hypothetical protein